MFSLVSLVRPHARNSGVGYSVEEDPKSKDKETEKETETEKKKGKGTNKELSSVPSSLSQAPQCKRNRPVPRLRREEHHVLRCFFLAPPSGMPP
jgi:hypothetical protein